MLDMNEIKNKPLPSNLEDYKSLALDLFNHIDSLETNLRLLTLKKYGRSSERHCDPNQQSLFDEVESLNEENITDGCEEDNKTKVDSNNRKKRRPKIELPANIARTTVVHDLENKSCECCGANMYEIGEDKTEKLNIIPAKISVKEDIYKKYACRNSMCDGKPKQALVPQVAVPRIKATMETLSFIAIQKYLYGMPLYRLEYFFDSRGCTVSRYVMSKWMIKLSEALKPIYKKLEEKLIQSSYLHIDETRLQVLKEEGRKATSQSYAWVRKTGDPNAPPIILFYYNPSRGAKIAKMLLEGFSGFVQSDDYEGYACALKGNDHVTRLLCWDHARRYFKNAYIAVPKSKQKNCIADLVLRKIKKLYKIEASIKKEPADSRLEVRQKESTVILADIKQFLEKSQPNLSRQSLTAKAILYTLDNWEKLLVYTNNPMLNISNSPAERAIKPFVIGRKAWLFCNTQAGAEASMILYSILMTAKANGLDPYIYLKDTLDKIPQIKTSVELENALPLSILT